MKKAYIFLADGFEEIEALTPADLLRRAGVEVCLVSLNQTAAVIGSHGIHVSADAVFEECAFDNADMLILPGGKVGTENLEQHGPLAELLLAANRKGTAIAAICAAPRVIGQLGLLNGKKACCYPGNESQLKGAQVVYDKVAVDGTMITSRGMGTAFPFGLALIEFLCGPEAAEAVARNTVYNL